MRVVNPLFVVFIFITVNLFAQTPQGSIHGKLQDSLSKQNLSLATVTIFRARDTAIVTYRLSDGNGEFKVPALPLHQNLRMLITFSGYRIYRHEFELTAEKAALDFGTLLLVQDAKALDEVLVYAERPPVSIRKDTIEFNASAFKTLPSALVEDLLKKLPEVDIDLEGNIMVKGKRVNRLLVDGKEFFGGDPKIATKNLPANIVDKVQVMDDKEQMERDPDISPADVGQVVNIKLKRAIKEGWFGKVYAGAGTDKRHETGIIVNAFRDTTQISFLGYSNNINKAGFGNTDLQKIGGFERSGGGDSWGVSRSGDGIITLEGDYFGGASQGIERALGGGLNFNHQAGKNFTLSFQYFYGEINSEYENLSNRTRFFGDTAQLIKGSSTVNSTTRNNRMSAAVIWKADSFTMITFRPGMTFSKNIVERYAGSLISDNVRGNLNSEGTDQHTLASRGQYNQSLLVSRTFRKKGRTLTLNQSLNRNESLSDQYFDILSQFYLSSLPASLSHQLRTRETWDYVNNINLNFTEPLSKTLSMRLQHAAAWNLGKNHLNPYNQDAATGKFNQIIDSLHSGLDRSQWRNVSTVGITWRKDKFTVTSSANFMWFKFENSYLKADPVNRQYFYVYPSVNIRWKDWNLSYNANVQPPSATDLQPVVDNTNRQFIFIGNPRLKPGYSSNISVNYFKFSPNGNSFSVYLAGSARSNGIMRENTVDVYGIQTSRPVNVDGLHSLSANANYSKQFNFNKKLKLSLRPAINNSYSESISSFNSIRNYSRNYNSGANLNVMFNYDDKVELNHRYRISLNRTVNENKKFFRDIETVTHSAESEIVVRYPKQIVWENTVSYFYNPNVGPGIRRNSVRWNAGVNYLFLKEDKGQVRLSVFDLLDQSVSVFRSTYENTINESQTTTLRRYFMLSFTYSLRTIIPAKVGARDRSFFFF